MPSFNFPLPSIGFKREPELLGGGGIVTHFGGDLREDCRPRHVFTNDHPFFLFELQHLSRQTSLNNKLVVLTIQMDKGI
jgi:hypothetical protein